MLYVNPSTTENPSKSISFRNICGVVKLSLKSTKKDIVISSILFRSESAIAGGFDVNIDADRKFKDSDNLIKMHTEYPENEIELVFEEYVTLGAEAKDFYIVVPPTESMGFEIEVQTSDFGRQIIKAPAVEANRIKRNVIKTMPTLDLEIVPREKWTDVASTGFSAGSGSVEDPYQISTPEELALLSKSCEDDENYSEGRYFKLMADLTMAEGDDEFIKNEWTPIKNFKGVFDGNGKSVKYEYEVISDRFALFDKNLGVIKNLIVLGRIYGEKYVAGIAVENNGTIINCANNLNIHGEDYLGGICVLSNANNRIVNSYNNAEIYVSDEIPVAVGGIIAQISEGTRIENCFNTRNGYISNGAAIGFATGLSSLDNVLKNVYYVSSMADVAVGGIGSLELPSTVLPKTKDDMNTDEFTELMNANAAAYNSTDPAPAEKACKWERDIFPMLDFGTVAVAGVEYVDEYGKNRGLGIKIGETIWAPVNCGYQPAGEVDVEALGYPYGKLYQWGRKYGQGYGDSDASFPTGDNFVQGPVSNEEGNKVENKDKFYKYEIKPKDWCTPQLSEWSSEYDPCPEGWRVPTKAEFDALMDKATANIGWDATKRGYWLDGTASPTRDNTKSVFFPAAGWHNFNGYVSSRGFGGNYWSSSVNGTYAHNLCFDDWSVNMLEYFRAEGYSVRCVKSN